MTIEEYYDLALSIWRARYWSWRGCEEDAVQEAVINCWKARSSYDESKGSLRSFMAGVILRTYYPFVRTRRNLPMWRLAKDFGGEIPDTAECLRLRSINQVKVMPTHLAVEVRNALIREMSKQGRRHGDIAKELGVSKHTVSKATKSLRLRRPRAPT